MRTYPYDIWDVFTVRPLTGNPLAVFLDGTGLTSDEMLALARETNLSETTFILPRSPEVEAERGVRVRIFTPREELPFAGHPVLGTAMAWQALTGSGARVVLDLDLGPIPVDFETLPDGGLLGTMAQQDATLVETHHPSLVAPLLGLHPDDVSLELPIQTASTGRPKIMVPVRTLAALQAARLEVASAERYCAALDRQCAFYLVCPVDGGETPVFRTRHLLSWGEDPVTGSAGGAAAGWLAHYGAAPSGAPFLLRQGEEVHRPGEMRVSAVSTENGATEVRVGGSAVRVARGNVLLP